MTDEMASVEQSAKLVQKIRPLLAGQASVVIGATLADLSARLLAGFFAETEQETADLREALLMRYMNLIRDLINVNQNDLLQRLKKDAN